jgi:hypothetical protein
MRKMILGSVQKMRETFLDLWLWELLMSIKGMLPLEPV